MVLVRNTPPLDNEQTPDPSDESTTNGPATNDPVTNELAINELAINKLTINEPAINEPATAAPPITVKQATGTVLDEAGVFILEAMTAGVEHTPCPAQNTHAKPKPQSVFVYPPRALNGGATFFVIFSDKGALVALWPTEDRMYEWFAVVERAHASAVDRGLLVGNLADTGFICTAPGRYAVAIGEQCERLMGNLGVVCPIRHTCGINQPTPALTLVAETAPILAFKGTGGAICVDEVCGISYEKEKRNPDGKPAVWADGFRIW